MFLTKIASYKKDIKDILNISMPIVASQLGIILMGVMDTMMVARLGNVPLAALGFANHNYFFITVFGIGVFSIFPPLIAKAKSQNDIKECSRLFATGFRIALVMMTFTLILLLIFWLNLGNLGQEEGVSALASNYFLIISASAIPLFLIVFQKSFTDGLGFVRISMYISFFGLILNGFLNWVFIYGNLGFEPMGVIGAGYSTLLVRIFMMIGTFLYIISIKKIKRYLKEVSFKVFDKKLFFKILKLGIPSGLHFSFEVGAFAFAAVMVGWLGAEYLAAHEIAMSLITITFMVVTGFAAAGGIKIGEAYGKKEINTMYRISRTTLFLAAVFMILCSVIFILFDEQLVNAFMNSDSPAFEKLDVGFTIEIAKSLMIVAGFFQLFDGIQVTSAGLLRGLADVKVAAVIGGAVYWFVGLPVAYILCFVLKKGVWGIWIGLAIALILASILLTLRFFYLLKKNNFSTSKDIS